MAGTSNRPGRAPKQPDNAPPRRDADTAPVQPPAATAPDREKLTVEAILAAVNDGADDAHTVAVLNTALYRAGAQDPSMELPRSWQRVQRRLGLDRDHLDGVATAEQVTAFADQAGLAITP